jgi:hypothetical protein
MALVIERDLDHRTGVRVLVGLMSLVQTSSGYLAQATAPNCPLGDLRLVEVATQDEVDPISEEVPGFDGVGEIIEGMMHQEEAEARQRVAIGGVAEPANLVLGE